MREEFPLESTHMNDEGNIEIDKELLLTLESGNHVVGIYVSSKGAVDTEEREIPIGFHGIDFESDCIFEIPEVVAWKYIEED